MLGYDLLVYPFVTIWLAVFVIYLMLQGASTVAIGIFLGLMTLPIWAGLGGVA